MPCRSSRSRLASSARSAFPDSATTMWPCMHNRSESASFVQSACIESSDRCCRDFRAPIPRRNAEGREAHANLSSQGVICSAYSGRTCMGEFLPNSRRGAASIVSGDASGKICSVAMWPALPKEVADPGASGSMSSTRSCSRTRRQAIETPMIPAPTITIVRLPPLRLCSSVSDIRDCLRTTYCLAPAFSMYRSISRSSMSIVSPPVSSTASWKSLMSKFSPSSLSARPRSSSIVNSPIL